MYLQNNRDKRDVMSFRVATSLIGTLLVVLMSVSSRSIAQGPPGGLGEREIIHVTGNLYEARDQFRNTVFLVTPEGVILSDPLGVAFARWLKEEITERFDSTVKYVIYSHHHPDHSTGGTVFADTAIFIAHENTIAALNAPFPSNAGQMDLDGDGRIERAELTAPGYGGTFDLYNRNGDSYLTGDEITGDTPRPDIVYSERMSITLGGSRVDLFHPGPAHSEDMTILIFPEERAIFGVDLYHVRRFGVSLNGYDLEAYENAINRIQELDFDIVISGHGDIIGDRSDLPLFLGFLQALYPSVAAGIAAGESLEELLENLEFPGYQDWLLYENRRVGLITEAYELATNQ